jgi:uncharacterized lipoprotein YmbA
MTPKIAVVMLALVAGCTFLSPRHDPSRFYTLSARRADIANHHATAPSVVVGPVTFPAYLDRNEVAVRVSESELKYALSERWAEPLVQNFTRVLVEDLGTALGSDRVAGLASSTAITPDFWIEVVVLRFEASADGSAQLTARWAVRNAARKIVRVRQSQHARQSSAATTEGGVNALSATLGDLADEMAALVLELRADHANPS